MKVLSIMAILVISSVVWVHYTNGVVMNAIPFLTLGLVLCVAAYLSFKVKWENGMEVLFLFLSVIGTILYISQIRTAETNEIIALVGICFIIAIMIIFFVFEYFPIKRTRTN